MGVDRPDDADVPPDGQPDHRDDQGGDGDRAGRGGGAQAETRLRQEYYAELRVAVSAEESVTAQQTAAREQAAAEKWGETVKESRWMWAEYQRRWPPEERAAGRQVPPIRRVPGAETATGSWTAPSTAELKQSATVIAEREEEKISPALRAIESQDPDRHLIGFEHRLKGRDRIKEKVYGTMKELGSLSGAGCFACA